MKFELKILFSFKGHYSGKSAENEPGQLIEQLAVLHQEIMPKPNSATTF